MPGVNGQVVSAPALQASSSISSLAPATRMLGLCWSTASAGSFCLFSENGEAGLPTDTTGSWTRLADAGNAATPTAVTIDTASDVPVSTLLISPLLR